MLLRTLPASPASQEHAQAQTPFNYAPSPGFEWSQSPSLTLVSPLIWKVQNKLNETTPVKPETVHFHAILHRKLWTGNLNKHLFFFFLLSKVIKSGKIWSRGTAFDIQRISPLVFSCLASLADEVAEGEGTPHCSDGEGWGP